MKLRTLIADDEPLALGRLRRLLSGVSTVELVGEAANGSQLVMLADKMNPELIITDIKMPGKSGLDAVQEICHRENPPAIIFCTAFDHYAVKAFEVATIGYLVKPIEQDKLLAAINQATVVNQAQLALLADDKPTAGRLLVDSVGAVESIDLVDIDYFQAQDKSVVAYLQNREIVVDYSLSELTQMLGDRVLRVHRSTLVNPSRIKRLFKGESNQMFAEFISGQQVVVSRRMVASVKRAFRESV